MLGFAVAEISVSGTPLVVVAGGTTYTESGSGGVSFGGAVTVVATAAPPIAGGLVLGGLGTEAAAYAPTPSGGLVLGGEATAAGTYAPESAGGLTAGGTGSVALTLVPPIAGGLVLGGLGTEAATYAPTPSGGLVLGGEATAAGSYTITISGGVVLGGAATESLGTGGPPVLILPLTARYTPTLELASSFEAICPHPAAYDPTLILRAEVSSMPPEYEIRVVRAQDLTLRWTLDRKRSVSGWTVKFTVRERAGGAARVEKTAALTDSTNGVFSVTLAKADTSGVTLSEELAEGEAYLWDLTRTDSGSRVTMARGLFVLEREAALL